MEQYMKMFRGRILIRQMNGHSTISEKKNREKNGILYVVLHSYILNQFSAIWKSRLFPPVPSNVFSFVLFLFFWIFCVSIHFQNSDSQLSVSGKNIREKKNQLCTTVVKRDNWDKCDFVAHWISCGHSQQSQCLCSCYYTETWLFCKKTTQKLDFLQKKNNFMTGLIKKLLSSYAGYANMLNTC